MEVSPVTFDDDVYEIPAGVMDDIPQAWRSGPAEVTPATCTLKAAVRCPHCGEAIRAVHVLGLTGARAASGSGAQPRGLVVTCPECEGSVPTELTGL